MSYAAAAPPPIQPANDLRPLPRQPTGLQRHVTFSAGKMQRCRVCTAGFFLSYDAEPTELCDTCLMPPPAYTASAQGFIPGENPYTQVPMRRQQPSATTTTGAGAGAGADAAQPPEPVMCDCQKPTAVFLVKKETSKYYGKFLHCCADFQGLRGRACDYWQIDGEPRRAKRVDVMPPANCKCGVPSKELRVVKEGANKGRPFQVCGRNRDCNFFQFGELSMLTAR